MSTLLKEAIEEFLLAGDQRGLSGGMLYIHRYYLGRLRKWLESRGVVSLDDLSKRVLREWGIAIRDEGWKPATLRNATRSVRQFLHWCADEELIAVDLSGALSLPRVPQSVQRTVTTEEVGKLLAVCDGACDGEVVAGRRNAAIVCLLFDSMVRAEELLSLRVSDVDLGRRRLVVLGKRKDQRIATFGAATALRLSSWLSVRPPNPDPAGLDALFVNVGQARTGYPLCKTSLRKLLAALSEMAGVPHLSAHAFRRGGACELAMQNYSTRGIMAKGGWSTLQQVERYTRALQLEIMFPDANPMDGVSETPKSVG